MKYTTTALAIAGMAATVRGHGFLTSPKARMPGTAFQAACGQQVYYNQAGDNYGNVQGELQVAKTQTDYKAAECDIWLCKGFKYEDNKDLVQTYTAGQKVPIKFEVRAPHTGTANVSIVDTATNTIIGTPLISWDVYASTASGIPADQTSFDITIPEDLGSKCSTAGACVIQHCSAAPAASGSASGTVAAYGQCGGKSYTGATQCASGYTCKVQNDYYSQCIAGSAKVIDASSAASSTSCTSTITITKSSSAATSTGADSASTGVNLSDAVKAISTGVPSAALTATATGAAPTGTWLNSDSGSLKGGDDLASNVTRISRAIKPASSDSIPQIIYYHYGVGSQGGIVDRVYGGATGQGLSEAVREGYSYLATNWEIGDEIFLFGFSRGAFTARAIASLIDNIGMLTKDGLPYLAEIFRDVQHRHDPDYKPKHPNKPFKNKPSVMDPRYSHELERRGMTRLRVPIKVIGVWDTVGTPRIGWLEKVGIQSSASKRMSFYDTRLCDCVEYAFQALALDERRSAFQPALWEKKPGNETVLRQVWFPGVHSNVGGGLEDQELANITLAWMMSQVTPFLDMDLDYVLDQQDDTERYYKESKQKPRSWSFGKIVDSMTGIYALGGATTRTPGRYYVVDPTDGRKTDIPLQSTHEYMHPSVRSRFRLKGPGVNEEGLYEPKALRDWKLYVEYDGEKGRGGRPDIFWKLRTSDRNVTARTIPEAPLWPLERELLEIDPEIEDFVLRPAPTARNSVRRMHNASRSQSRRR
ncbi:hypothetical protein D6D01_04659 [Aureobasidium pullulans]|uniref:CBM1 domain-containing protein n=1 Tax=Aureobasidium pullulans TaxID=5580 RepID=A0A4V6TEV1_AURPU|nr:hypothetical protein D6D01_04659 [Aureobasidium pullulans]